MDTQIGPALTRWKEAGEAVNKASREAKEAKAVVLKAVAKKCAAAYPGAAVGVARGRVFVKFAPPVFFSLLPENTGRISVGGHLPNGVGAYGFPGALRYGLRLDNLDQLLPWFGRALEAGGWDWADDEEVP